GSMAFDCCRRCTTQPDAVRTCRSNGKGPGQRLTCPRLRRRGRYLRNQNFGAEQKSSLFARARELARELFASPRRVCPTAGTANSSVGRSVIENHSQLLYIRLMVSRE